MVEMQKVMSFSPNSVNNNIGNENNNDHDDDAIYGGNIEHVTPNVIKI